MKIRIVLMKITSKKYLLLKYNNEIVLPGLIAIENSKKINK
jgi:hypothetical protein